MSDMFICPTCKRPTKPTDNEIIEHLAKEIDRYTEVLIIRTKELDRKAKALAIAVDALGRILNHATAIDTARCRAEMALKEITELEQKDGK